MFDDFIKVFKRIKRRGLFRIIRRSIKSKIDHVRNLFKIRKAVKRMETRSSSLALFIDIFILLIVPCLIVLIAYKLM